MNSVSHVKDETEFSEKYLPATYSISSYGADYDVDGIIRRLDNGDIFIPDFQREYVWNINEASRLIESVILGLPIPGVFLAKEDDTGKMLVIDGQQRLKSLQFFKNGVFDPSDEQSSHKIFKLSKVHESIANKTYNDLSAEQRRTFDNAIIHATVVRQDRPSNDDTSIYHIFERLNNGGRKLFPQEIRVAIYHGSLMDTIKILNGNQDWRYIFGPKSKRLKDQELVLRFLALYFSTEVYSSPMVEFLNRFSLTNQNAAQTKLNLFTATFESAISVIREALGQKAFRPERALNAAVMDAVMIGLARRLERGQVNTASVANAYTALIKNTDFISFYSRATAQESSVQGRIKLSTEAFAQL